MDLRKAETAAVRAARAVGVLMRRHLATAKRASLVTQHDIKLELDVRSQHLIERTLAAALPQVSLLGEEGIKGRTDAEYRWVVDPIDGTVNFAYGIPHACISIALQQGSTSPSATTFEDGYQTRLGVVYDPFCDELWTAVRGRPAYLNGKTIHVSQRSQLDEAIVSIGFAKFRTTLKQMLPVLNHLVHRVRKIRIMGAAALAMTYVASGRMDAYIEAGIRLWDIAAGGLILECAGGDFWHEPMPGKHKFRIMANNGLLRSKLRSFI